jgi:hypothetical protein
MSECNVSLAKYFLQGLRLQFFTLHKNHQTMSSEVVDFSHLAWSSAPQIS